MNSSVEDTNGSGNPAELAMTDSLTGLGNRARFYDKMERLIAERAEDPAPFAIGIIDLDGFIADQRSVRPQRWR